MVPWRHFLIRFALPVLVFPVCGCVNADDPAAGEDQTRAEEAVSEALSDTPYINALLIDREFPLIGGYWGWDLFVDAPLNGEPEGANVTLRRAKGKYIRELGNDWTVEVSADYTDGGGLQFSDSNFSWRGWDRTVLTLGIYDPAFSLESISKSSALTFMERALPVAALSESKSGGIGILRRNTRSILDATLVLFNIDRDDHREDGQGIVLHYVHSPIEAGNSDSLHLGGSFSYRWNATTDGTLFRSRPEVATVNDYFVDTGFIEDADRIGRLSLEASQVLGRFSWQSEVLATQVQRKSGGDVRFWGTYAYASWFLTKHARNYRSGTGKFGSVRVDSPILEGGWGAFEIAARASLVDLTDKEVVGGRQKNLSIGLNWYLNQRIRLMTNLVKVVDLVRPGSGFDGQDPLIFSLRAQWVID
jgi:phosphate-selective porin OprO/OprP